MVKDAFFRHKGPQRPVKTPCGERTQGKKGGVLPDPVVMRSHRLFRLSFRLVHLSGAFHLHPAVLIQEQPDVR